MVELLQELVSYLSQVVLWELLFETCERKQVIHALSYVWLHYVDMLIAFVRAQEWFNDRAV